MNAMMIFNEIAKRAQSDRDYYIFGKPYQIGIIEDLLAYFGMNYNINSHSETMHRSNLEILRNFITMCATEEQLKFIHSIAGPNAMLPKSAPSCDAAGLVFVSMPMNKSKCAEVDIIRKGIANGIKLTGNHPYFLDMDSHNTNITVKMLDEIRACKFLVADFTSQNTGVYYEAGYATALGKTVIHTCKASDFEKLHFDIKQTQIVIWETAEELASKLSDQIKGTHLGAFDS